MWLVTWRKRWKLLYIGKIILWIKHYKTAQALLSWVGNEVGEEGRGGNKTLRALLLVELLVDWYKTFIWGHNEYVIGRLGSTVIRLDFLSFGRALCIQLSMLCISRKCYCAVGVFYEAIALLEKLQVFMLLVAYGRQPYFISIQQVHKNAVKENCVLSYYFYMWQIKMAMIGCSVTAESLGIVFLLCYFFSSHMQNFRKGSAQRFALK